ncbi:MAG: hypothetical protein IT559_08420 [Alphaproteobacteria bacterium]|nr:hypothetical protein [Alphaproteobacteria bacterium]
MRGFSIIFLLLIPAMIALGHDLYLFYVNYAEAQGFSIALLQKEFKLSAFGFIWTNYDEESYKTAVGSVDPDTWLTIDYLLTFKAFYAALAFAGVFVALFTVLALFGKGPFAGEERRVYGSDKKKKGEKSFRAGQAGTKMNYKRK